MKVTPKSDNEFEVDLNDKDLEHIEHMCRMLKITPSECLLLLLENGISNWLIHEPINPGGFF